MEDSGPIRVSVADTRQRKLRQRELWLAVAAVLFIVGLSWVELKFFGLGSHLFLFLFNFNFLLLVVVLGVVVQAVAKLVLERRRRVLGSRIRTRLVLAFVLLSLIPTVVLFVISVKFVQTSVDFWFQVRVEETLENSLDVGQDIQTLHRERLRSQAESIISRAGARGLDWGSTAMDEYLRQAAFERELGLIGYFAGQDMDSAGWAMSPAWELAWPRFSGAENFTPAALERDSKWTAGFVTVAGTDLLLGLAPVPGGGWLAVGTDMGMGLSARLRDIATGLEEFQKLKTLKYPLQVALYMTLSVMTALIILGSFFFGLRLSKELLKPLQALAEGTRRVAQGDLAVRLEDQGDDEWGTMVRSFNSMAQDLEEGQERLKRQNRELDDRGRSMEAVLNNVTSGVISLDAAGRVQTVNRAAEAMLGLDRRELVGKSPLELVYGEYAQLVKSMLRQLDQGTATTQWQRQVRLKLGGRQRTYLVNVVSLITDDGRRSGIVAVFEDIGELEKMQRLAAWREVARRSAHEIKNPLTPIKLSAQRLQRRFGPQVEDPVFSESTQLIVQQAEHLQQMVTEFSAFAKLPEVAPRMGVLASLVREVVAMFRVSHKGVQWELTGEDDVPPVRFDPEGLRRVLINILTNAVEALAGQNSDGHVSVSLSHDPILERVFIEVADNGPGMSEEERSRLFEPYFSRKQGGTGLGLTIVNSIVSDHGGYVRVRQAKPHGTVMVVELPTGGE